MTMTRKTRYKVGPLYLVCDARLKEGSEVIFPQNSCVVHSKFLIAHYILYSSSKFYLDQKYKKKKYRIIKFEESILIFMVFSLFLFSFPDFKPKVDETKAKATGEYFL